MTAGAPAGQALELIGLQGSTLSYSVTWRGIGTPTEADIHAGVRGAAQQGMQWILFMQTLICNDKINDGAFEPDGSVKLTTGTLDYGQGHATPFAQVLSAELGVPFEKITLEQGDSDLVRFGNGTGGSRSITATGQAIVEASALVVAKGKQAAAHLMEASEGDIEFADGRFTIAGTDRSIGIMELAQRVREGKLPEEFLDRYRG